MQTFVNFGETYLHEALDLGCDGLRVETDGSWEDFLRPLVGSPLTFIFLLHDIARNEALLSAMGTTGFNPAGHFVEVFNELEGGRVDREIYISGVNQVSRDCKARGFLDRGLRVISGGLANMSRESQAFYADVVPRLDPDIIIGVHSYPHGTQTHYEQTAWPGYGSLDEQLDSFLRICAGRDAFISEFGWHTAEEEEGVFIWKQKVRLTDEQVYQYLCADLRRFARRPQVLGAVIYQWQDGPGEDYLSKFGLHLADGITRKRQAAAVRDWKET